MKPNTDAKAVEDLRFKRKGVVKSDTCYRGSSELRLETGSLDSPI